MNDIAPGSGMSVLARPAAPAWMGTVLLIAGVYNVAWGAFAVLLPNVFWDWLAIPRPNYMFLWQCIGMIVGVYGIGYWFAARDPLRHWPIVLVGLLGKIFGPIGFIDAYFIQGSIPTPWFGVTLLTNDLVWWVPFGLMLKRAWEAAEFDRRARLMSSGGGSGSVVGVRDIRAGMAAARTSEGVSLLEMSERSPVLVVFLRHLGCTFCREALSDMARAKPTIENAGVRICLVHMVGDEKAAAYFTRYNMGEAARVSDPGKALYKAFKLSRGTLAQLFGPRLWVRGFKAAILDRHFVGTLQGDGLQLPGAFLVRNGEIVRSFRHADAGDRPDYCEVAGA